MTILPSSVEAKVRDPLVRKVTVVQGERAEGGKEGGGRTQGRKEDTEEEKG